MHLVVRAKSASLVAALMFLQSAPALAQDLDIIAQAMNGQVVTGAVNVDDDPTDPDADMGIHIHTRSFDELFVLTEPGFNAIGSNSGNVPAGTQALPGGANLEWDFLPMKVGGYASTLLYWNGAGTMVNQVAFGPAPTGSYSLALYGFGGAGAAADGSAALIAGHKIEATQGDGFLHVHHPFVLDNDTDINNPTVIAEGIYLVAMRLRIAGLDRSEAFYLLWATPAATPAALTAAEGWLGSRVEQIAPDFQADFDGDLDVDGADFLTWQRGLGMSVAPGVGLQLQGDANQTHSVTAADLVEWRSQAGQTVANFPGAPAAQPAVQAAPEPASLALAAVALAALVGQTRLRARGRAARRRRP